MRDQLGFVKLMRAISAARPKLSVTRFANEPRVWPSVAIAAGSSRIRRDSALAFGQIQHQSVKIFSDFDLAAKT